MNQDKIDRYSAELYEALRDGTTVEPLTQREEGMSVEDAYHISLAMLRLRLDDGEKVVGKKIGVTGRVVQEMLDVRQPDFGFLTDAMVYKTEMPISERLVQPKAEGELAFVLKSALRGPGVTPEDVLEATEAVYPCFEVVDSRISDWKIRIEDTVADNASSGLFVLGDKPVDPRAVDLSKIEMKVYKNGALLSEGNGAASVIGSPHGCVAWLANTLGAFGIVLEAGEVILSGSLVPLEPVQAGDEMRAEISGVGEVSIRFT